ncbi:hypothetical protein HYE67_007499 [Fusarium culmorum]|uniref:Uncharacterized protein n=1 Tax=Fusarium culmorum TaxID=5516 RepID=A0A2T4H447_FUSCU|nr:hypothetical protein FCULG_00008592 [Fusarium culmorum]QPC65268.1 hypothetical protein HYE67_007499 [Fusarium culmorum]
MYHSARMAVNISDVPQNKRQLQHCTIFCSTCEPNHHGANARHRRRGRRGIRASAQDMPWRREFNLWPSMSQESSNSVSDISNPILAEEVEKKQSPQKIMRWPCNHHWGSRKCNEYVDSLGVKCLDCTNRKDMDSTPTHTRFAHMYDVEQFVEGFRNAGLNAACVVEMMKDGALEKALREALCVVQENDTAWHDRIKYVVPQGISRYKAEEAKGEELMYTQSR